jgi:hypothetical protein
MKPTFFPCSQCVMRPTVGDFGWCSTASRDIDGVKSCRWFRPGWRLDSGNVRPDEPGWLERSRQIADDLRWSDHWMDAPLPRLH